MTDYPYNVEGFNADGECVWEFGMHNLESLNSVMEALGNSGAYFDVTDKHGHTERYVNHSVGSIENSND